MDFGGSEVRAMLMYWKIRKGLFNLHNSLSNKLDIYQLEKDTNEAFYKNLEEIRKRASENELKNLENVEKSYKLRYEEQNRFYIAK
jgi:ribosomal 30S subunit maturation factor RimM